MTPPKAVCVVEIITGHVRYLGKITTKAAELAEPGTEIGYGRNTAEAYQSAMARLEKGGRRDR